MKKAELIAALVVTGAVVAATVAVDVGPSGAATGTDKQFVGYAGGSVVRALNNTVTSDLTAASAINTGNIAYDSNSTAGVTVTGLLHAGAIATSTRSVAVTGGYQVISRSVVTGVSALGGLITASAVDTTATAGVVNGVTSSSLTTKLVGVKVGTADIPVNIPKNFAITLPGIASVYLNYQVTGTTSDKAIALGAGIVVTLLDPVGTNAVGAVLAIDPVYSAIGPFVPPPSGHFLDGHAFGTSVHATVGSLVDVRSDETAEASVAGAAANGGSIQANIAGVNLTSLARVGAVQSGATSINSPSVYDAHTATRVAGVNLFNGLIRADAVTAEAHVGGTTSSTALTVAGHSGLVNLVVAGRVIAVNAAPNTTITIANLGRVVINQQIRAARSIVVRALDITLSTAAYGLPAGAEVQVAVATAGAS